MVGVAQEEAEAVVTGDSEVVATAEARPAAEAVLAGVET